MRDGKKKGWAYFLIGIVVVIALAFLAAKVSAHVSRRRAEQLLHNLRQLQVGKSTFEEARAFSVAHGGGVSPFDHSGCNLTHCTFEVAIKHYPLLMEVWGPSLLSMETTWQVVRVLPAIGLQDWHAGATVLVDGGIVTKVNYGVFVRGNGGSVLGRHTDELLVKPEHLRQRMGQRSYFVSWFTITTVGGGEGIKSTLTPQANAEERNRAYDVDFGCLTKLGGCTSLRQMAPNAFADLVKEVGEMPWLDAHDPHCARFKLPK